MHVRPGLSRRAQHRRCASPHTHTLAHTRTLTLTLYRARTASPPPQEAEIAENKDHIKKMDGELEQYNKTNRSLELTIANMRLKQSGLANEVLEQRREKQDASAVLRRFQHDLNEVVAYMQVRGVRVWGLGG